MSTERQRTRVIVLVHSHQDNTKGGIDISRDVIGLNVSKSIKGPGTFSITLVPRKNYYNYIFPNDVVNIYIDPGDGKRGFIRTMMGYVDRIERTESTGDNGQLTTEFRIAGTDFMKAMMKTEVYFNPALATRSEFVDTFGKSQLGGGHALRTTGITIHGTPAQFVENFLSLLLGFGTQWVLPRSYPTENFLDKMRSNRKQRAKARIPAQLRESFRSAFGVDIEQFGLTDDLENRILSADIKSALDQVSSDELSPGSAAGALEHDIRKSILADIKAASLELAAFRTVLQETSKSSSASVIDVLSLDFIETLCIDGFVQSAGIWTGSGTVASMLSGWSNEIVNELCFDLRPVASGDGDQCFGALGGTTNAYSTDADDLGVNVSGTAAMPSSVAGVKYVPAVVFREYPFSVVQGVDLRGYYITSDADGSPLPYMPFGPIFAQNIGKAGRVFYNYEDVGVDALIPEKCVYDPNSPAIKHLDVVTIRNTDVTGSTTGRSDNDIINLAELYANDPTAKFWKYLISDILPILTPASVARHGLRKRQMNTAFANYGRDQLCAPGSSAVDSGAIRRNLIRWALLMDHWDQHNVEYLSGSIALRGMPEIRVGYRLDWIDRNESYYVEAVGHQWQYPGALRTTVEVSRGQRNDPLPVYIPPVLPQRAGVPAGAPSAEAVSPSLLPETLPQSPVVIELSDEDINRQRTARSSALARGGGGDRSEDGRLGKFFPIKDTSVPALAVGGEAKFGGDNDVDKFGNVKGRAVFPGENNSLDASDRSTSAGEVPGDGSSGVA